MSPLQHDERIRRALISVSDKSGVVEFARKLHGFGVEILSTGGTARALREAGVPVMEVSEFTGFPEMLDGRVKTLHPKVHGGLLFLRDNPEHQRAMESQGLQPIDLVVVNLYPFEATVERPGVTREEAIEQIDIGGPSMLRSAAKNHRWVTVACRPERYREIIEEMERRSGATSLALRERLAIEVFRTTAAYDRAIGEHLGGPSPVPDLGESPRFLDIRLRKEADLRYGENPHQRGALYSWPGSGWDQALERLHGKELSHNNLLDISAAEGLAEEFPDRGPAAVVIVKHMNPCGVGMGETVGEAWRKALATDPEAASGGIVAVNRTIEPADAAEIDSIFTEVLIAPGYSAAALELFQKKKNRILIRRKRLVRELPPPLEIRSVPGGLLVQDPDRVDLDPAGIKVATRRGPTAEEMEALRFAFRVAKHVKSNAIVFAGRDRTLGIGAGQMSRVDSVRLAAAKAGRAGLSLSGSVVASDAFFPFADGLIAAAEAGATAAIQPGGSKRDAEVISAADERGMAMVFTGIRHFRH
jgi:phosphoribosylaminoimidazolecarboxamide formyltransferase / IMP cyclohydrolase